MSRKFFVWIVAALMSTTVSTHADEASAKAWVARYQRYSAQKEMPVESGYSPRQGPTKFIRLSELLEALPEPQAWPELKRVTGDTLTRIPARRKLDRERLQTADWLLAYLLGDQAGIREKITALLAAENDPGLRTDSLKRLLESLDKRSEKPSEQDLKQFEAQLLRFEPVSDEVVRIAVGGEENFSRLKRMLVLQAEFRNRSRKVFEELALDRNESAALRKIELLDQEFEKAFSENFEPLRSSGRNPVVQRYVEINDGVDGESDGFSSVNVPDLVTVVGRERAEALLRRALQLRVKLVVNTGDETRRLAREIALAQLDQLGAPQWSLVSDGNSVDLFEALQKKFPTDSKGFDFESAKKWYLGGLIMAGRTDDAVKFSTEGGGERNLDLSSDLLDQLERGQRQQALWTFLRAWLPKNPGADEWDRFNRLSVELGRHAELLRLVETMATDARSKVWTGSGYNECRCLPSWRPINCQPRLNDCRGY